MNKDEASEGKEIIKSVRKTSKLLLFSRVSILLERSVLLLASNLHIR